MPAGRKIVIIGHAIQYEFAVLERFGFFLHGDNIKDNRIVGVIDTQWIAWRICSWPHPRLEEILQKVGCVYGELHTAGHDAFFALRAFLAMSATLRSGAWIRNIRATWCSKERNPDEHSQDRWRAITAVTETSLPFPVEEHYKVYKDEVDIDWLIRQVMEEAGTKKKWMAVNNTGKHERQRENKIKMKEKRRKPDEKTVERISAERASLKLEMESAAMVWSSRWSSSGR